MNKKQANIKKKGKGKGKGKAKAKGKGKGKGSTVDLGNTDTLTTQTTQ